MDERFTVPVLTVSEAARHLGYSYSTLRHWLHTEAGGAPLVHWIEPESPRGPKIPFIALAEAQFYRTLRQAGLSPRAIRDAVARLRTKLDREYALAWRKLAHNGVDVLADMAESGDAPEWTRVRDQQGGIKGIVERGLQPIVWADDDYPRQLRLNAYGDAEVIIDPRFGFGRPVYADQGVRVEDVVDLFSAGEATDVVAEEFGLTDAQVQAALRLLVRRERAAA